jgi:hypothetical protein
LRPPEPRPDRQRQLNIEILLNDLLASLVEAIAGSAAQRGDDIAVAARTGGRSKLAANAKQRREQRGLEQGSPVIVNLVLKTGITGAICALFDAQEQ